MADLSEKHRAAGRAAMPEIARMKPSDPSAGVRSKVTAVGTTRKFACGGKVKMAAGGAAKQRKGFPMTKSPPAKGK